MKQWVKKIAEQFDLDFGKTDKPSESLDINEERATILFILDIYSKNLFDFDKHPVRRTRESLDLLMKGLVNPQGEQTEKLLFRLRQFFSSYRIDEYTYLQKTFDDFKGIIWDFADQLAEDIRAERREDSELNTALEDLKEAVEANSIDALKTKAREFIDNYVEKQTRKENRRSQRMDSIQRNLHTVKKQLLEANQSMRQDHLTGAFNRRSFDEQLKKIKNMHEISKTPSTLIIMDIDFFKKINDTYGHDIGDFVLKECVRTLKDIFHRDSDFVARIGGEEFAIILPDHKIEHALIKAEEALNRIRSEVFVKDTMELRFTVSMGIAQILDNEQTDQWLKRADTALYNSKHTGRNRYTIAFPHSAANAA